MLDTIWLVWLELAPWLLLGTAIAALLHVALPPSFVHRQFKGRGGVAKAVALGVPMPLCSCGVIPTAVGLKKQGASDGSAVGFLISTPQTGVDSILVSASFLGWPFAVFKVASAAVLGLIGGLATDRVSKTDASGSDDRTPSPRTRRTIRDGFDHGVMLIRTIWRWLVVGVLASAALTTWVPPDAFAGLAGAGGVLALVAVLAISVPLYVCATASVPIAAALVASGFPPGAALVFLIAGPATNVATVGAVHRALGRRALVVYLATVVGGSLLLALAFDFVLGSGKPPVALAAHHHSAAWWQLVAGVGLALAFAYFALDDVRRLARRWRVRTHPHAGSRAAGSIHRA